MPQVHKSFGNKFKAGITIGFILAISVGCREYQQRIDTYLQAAHTLWGFDGTVLIGKNGKILYTRGFGMANQKFGEANTPKTKFYIGSLTKQFTAAAIMALQDDGLLNVDNPIIKYLPDYPHDPGERITVRQLLTHTSGIPNYTDDIEVLFKRTQPMSEDEIIAEFENRPLDFEPGTKFKYSNSGYILLGKIIENVSGQSYEAYLHHKIFKPAGMHDSGYGRREAGLPDRADGYTNMGNGRIVDALPVDLSVLYSSGALYSTAIDMCKWDAALRTDKILGHTSLQAMLTPEKNNYGFGWVIDTTYHHLHTYHGGFLDGFNTIFDRWLDDSLCVVVFSNEDEAPVNKIARGVAAILFDEPYIMPGRKKPARIDERELKEYEGVYQTTAGTNQIVEYDEGVLSTHMQGTIPKALLPQAKDTFFLTSDNSAIVAFSRDKAGVVVGLTNIDDGYGLSAMKLHGPAVADMLINRTPIRVDSTILRQYAGTYQIDPEIEGNGPGITLKVSMEVNHLIVIASDGESIEVFPSSETRFFHKDADFQITFFRDGAGQASKCHIQVGGLKVDGHMIR